MRSSTEAYPNSTFTPIDELLDVSDEANTAKLLLEAARPLLTGYSNILKYALII